MTPKSGSLPDPEELKRTLLERYEENRKVIVGVAVLLTVGIIGLVFYFSLGRQAANEDWYDLFSASQPMLPRLSELEELSDRGSRDLKSHALLQLANASIMNRDYEKAISALERLNSEFGDTTLARLPSPDRRMPLPQLILDQVKKDGEWEKKYGYDEDPKVDTTQVALVETDKGGFWIGFFPEYAPKHVENFIAKAKEGAFNGTQFYHVSSTQARFGGATTRDDADETNDASEAEGATYLEPERGRYRIQHRRGMVSSVRTDEGESAEKVTVAFSWASDLNKRQTVFGKVLADRGAGLEHLDEIKNVTTYATSKDQMHREERYMDLPDHPIEPLRVLRISIWSKDKIEDGHTWDTAAVDSKSADAKPKEEKKPDETVKDEDAEKKPTEAKSEEK